MLVRMNESKRCRMLAERWHTRSHEVTGNVQIIFNNMKMFGERNEIAMCDSLGTGIRQLLHVLFPVSPSSVETLDILVTLIRVDVCGHLNFEVWH